MTQNHSIFSDENIPTPVIRANDLDVVHRQNQDLHYHEERVLRMRGEAGQKTEGMSPPLNRFGSDCVKQ